MAACRKRINMACIAYSLSCAQEKLSREKTARSSLNLLYVLGLLFQKVAPVILKSLSTINKY